MTGKTTKNDSTGGRKETRNGTARRNETKMLEKSVIQHKASASSLIRPLVAYDPPLSRHYEACKEPDAGNRQERL